MKRYHESLQLVQTLRGIPLKIFILFLLFGGLGALRVEASGQDSLSVERVNKIGASNESRLAHDIGLVRFEPSGHPKLAQQVDALRVVVDIRNHRNFKAFELTDELLGRIARTIFSMEHSTITSSLGLSTYVRTRCFQRLRLTTLQGILTKYRASAYMKGSSM